MEDPVIEVVQENVYLKDRRKSNIRKRIVEPEKRMTLFHIVPSNLPLLTIMKYDRSVGK